jgi:hypothetical protein
MVKAHLPKDTDYVNKEYDVGFINLGESLWHNETKNWTLALKCIEEIVTKTGFRVLIVGREPPAHIKSKVEMIKFIPFNEFLTYLGKMEILMIPSVSDASPRILT